jgi:hypothetical protein
MGRERLIGRGPRPARRAVSGGKKCPRAPRSFGCRVPTAAARRRSREEAERVFRRTGVAHRERPATRSLSEKTGGCLLPPRLRLAGIRSRAIEMHPRSGSPTGPRRASVSNRAAMQPRCAGVFRVTSGTARGFRELTAIGVRIGPGSRKRPLPASRRRPGGAESGCAACDAGAAGPSSKERRGG